MKLLVTVAHPDDESFGCGSVLAHAAASGWETTVWCATRGELGEIAPEAAAGGVRADDLGAVREAELREAAAVFGVARVDVAGWRDSGVDGDPAPGSLVAAPAAEVESAIAAVIEELQPDVVVTLAADDGHRDHAKVRDATLAALRTTEWRPAATYRWCLPRSLMSRFTGSDQVGTPDDEITTVVDVARHLELRWQAMRAHRSQAPPYDAMDADLQREFLVRDHLQRVDPPWSGGPPEADWIPAAERAARTNAQI